MKPERDKPTPEEWAAIFEDDARAVRLLEELVVQFSKPAITDGGIDAVLKTYHRMGEQSVVQFILRKINQAHDVPDLEGEPDE